MIQIIRTQKATSRTNSRVIRNLRRLLLLLVSALPAVFFAPLAGADSFDVFAAIRDFINSGAKTPIYACVVDGSDGELVIGADPDDALGKVWAQLVAAYDNADRTCSFMFQIINEPA